MAASLNSSSRGSELWDEHRLIDLVQFVELPKPVAVTLGSYVKGDVKIKQGDLLLLRSDIPLYVSLLVLDNDAASNIVVSSDCPVKFNVVPPKDGTQECELGLTGIYPTIRDLLNDCPTYFEATWDFDDPYIPRYSIKKGDKFRFERIIRNADLTHVKLECTDERGKVVFLSGECRGYFNPIVDDNSYTLRELISKASISRRLKLAKLTLLPTEIDISDERKNDEIRHSVGYEVNEDKDIIIPSPDRASLPGLPLTYKGVLTLKIPDSTMEVSPWNELDIRWYIPVDIDIKVKLYSSSDYEVPVHVQKTPSVNLYEFVSTHQCFPLVASIMDCTDIPRAFASSLRNTPDIIVHRTTRLPCLIVKSEKKEYFTITPNVHVSFTDHPRSYSFVFDLVKCALGTQVRVMGDVASDFPAPYSLRYGDVIKVTTKKSFGLKMKSGPIPEFQVLKCEKLNDKGEFVKIMLPIDLEIELFEMMDMSGHKLYKLSDILSKKQKLPSGPVSVMEDDKMTDRLSLPPVVTLECVLADEVILVSPLKKELDGNLDPLVKTCLAIPTRSNLFLAYNKNLDIPCDYFILPRSKHRKNIPVENISEGALRALQRRNVSSETYEDIDMHKSDICDTDSLGTEKTESSSRVKQKVGRSINRLSRILSKPFVKKTKSTTKDIVLPPGLPGAPSFSRAEGNVYTKTIQEGANLSYEDNIGSDDEDDTYETVDFMAIHANKSKSTST